MLQERCIPKLAQIGTKSGKGASKGFLYRTICKLLLGDCNVSSIYTVNSRDHMVGNRVSYDAVFTSYQLSHHA